MRVGFDRPLAIGADQGVAEHAGAAPEEIGEHRHHHEDHDRGVYVQASVQRVEEVGQGGGELEDIGHHQLEEGQGENPEGALGQSSPKPVGNQPNRPADRPGDGAGQDDQAEAGANTLPKGHLFDGGRAHVGEGVDQVHAVDEQDVQSGDDSGDQPDQRSEGHVPEVVGLDLHALEDLALRGHPGDDEGQGIHDGVSHGEDR